MKAGVAITVDGESVDLAEVSWAMYARCGCLAGLTLGYLRPMGKDDAGLFVVTAEQAEAQFNETPQERERARERGFTYKPIRKRDIPTPWTDCQHDPKFGYEKPPKPDGYVWAAVHALGSRPKYTHLVPVAAVEAARNRDMSVLDVKPLCGGKAAYWWKDEWYAKDGKVECQKCIAAAQNLAVSA